MELHHNDGWKWILNCITACHFFNVFNQSDYARAVLLQVAQCFYLKETKHPIWNLFKKSPHSFLEVKGEWSLASLTSSLSNSDHLDIKQASLKYQLTKSVTEVETNLNNGIKFFGYPKYQKKWYTTSPEVNSVINFLKEYMEKLSSDDSLFMYPKSKAFCYGKKSSISLIPVSDIHILQLDTSSTMEQIFKAEDLLLRNNTSGTKFYPAETLSSSEDELEVEDEPITSTYEIGKILKHRFTLFNTLEFFIKWKWFSDEDNSWESEETLGSNDIVSVYKTIHGL